MRKIGLSIAAMMLMGTITACSMNTDEQSGEEKEEDQAVTVETEAVTQDDLVTKNSIYGRTEPDQTTPIMVENPGEVTDLKVNNGDHVDEDDHLATIDSPAGEQSISAPASGEIAQLNVKEGDMASGSDPLMVIADVSDITLSLNVTVDERREIKEDETYTALIDGVEYDADVTSISPMPDDTGLYPVEATVSNDDDDILSGMVGQLVVPEKQIESGLIVPTEAVVTEGGESFVYVIKDNKAAKKSVTVKETQSDKTAVEGDIQEEDKVVVNGLLTLSDGVSVNVVQEEDNS